MRGGGRRMGGEGIHTFKGKVYNLCIEAWTNDEV